MDQTTSPLYLIEKRIAELEKRVYNGDESDVKKNEKCIEALMSMHNKLQSVVTGRERITMVFSKLDELEKFLQPEYADCINLPKSSKIEMILSVEDTVRDVVDSLQTVKDLEQYLNSEHIKVTSALYPRLRQLNKAEMLLTGNTSAFNEESKKLASEYNSIITTLSKQFILWDSIVTELEIKKLDVAV